MNKLYCNECEKEVIPVKGKCPICGLDFNPDVSNLRPFNEPRYYQSSNVEKTIEYGSKNSVASVFKIISYILIGLGFIIGFIQTNEAGEEALIIFITDLLIYGGIALGCYALAEIIQILHDIREKVWRKK